MGAFSRMHVTWQTALSRSSAHCGSCRRSHDRRDRRTAPLRSYFGTPYLRSFDHPLTDWGHSASSDDFSGFPPLAEQQRIARQSLNARSPPPKRPIAPERGLSEPGPRFHQNNHYNHHYPSTGAHGNVVHDGLHLVTFASPSPLPLGIPRFPPSSPFVLPPRLLWPHSTTSHELLRWASSGRRRPPEVERVVLNMSATYALQMSHRP